MTGLDLLSARQQAVNGIEAAPSSAGTEHSLPRREVAGLKPAAMINRSVGDGGGPVLKTVSTATCGDRDLSAAPFQRRLTGQGPARPAGNRAVRESVWASCAGLPPFRKVTPAGAGRPFEAGWMDNHWGSRPRPSTNSRATVVMGRLGTGEPKAL
jgi:hypothetical protein